MAGPFTLEQTSADKHSQFHPTSPPPPRSIGPPGPTPYALRRSISCPQNSFSFSQSDSSSRALPLLHARLGLSNTQGHPQGGLYDYFTIQRSQKSAKEISNLWTGTLSALVILCKALTNIPQAFASNSSANLCCMKLIEALKGNWSLMSCARCEICC